MKEKRERYLAHVVAELLYSTGLVVGEVKLLKPEDVNLSRRTVTAWIPQNRNHRTVNRVLLQGAASLNLAPCMTRMFRHALCLHLVKAGCDARFVQELAGHEDLSTTQLYMRLDKRDLRGTLDQFHPRAAMGEREENIP